jgi:hypothetical protein
MASGSRNNNQLVVPQAAWGLEQLKYEVALELGIEIPADGYYGYMATRDTGAIGGQLNYDHTMNRKWLVDRICSHSIATERYYGTQK